MTNTLVDLDRERVSRLQRILGTDTIKATVDKALRIAEEHEDMIRTRREEIEFGRAGGYERLLDPELQAQMWR